MLSSSSSSSSSVLSVLSQQPFRMPRLDSIATHRRSFGVSSSGVCAPPPAEPLFGSPSILTPKHGRHHSLDNGSKTGRSDSVGACETAASRVAPLVTYRNTNIPVGTVRRTRSLPSDTDFQPVARIRTASHNSGNFRLPPLHSHTPIAELAPAHTITTTTTVTTTPTTCTLSQPPEVDESKAPLMSSPTRNLKSTSLCRSRVKRPRALTSDQLSFLAKVERQLEEQKEQQARHHPLEGISRSVSPQQEETASDTPKRKRQLLFRGYGSILPTIILETA